MSLAEDLDISDQDRVARDNPHIAQVFSNGLDCGYSLRTTTEAPARILHHGQAGRSKYRRRQHEVKSVLHWGQRKLLLAEIEFLTHHGPPQPQPQPQPAATTTVVYAGAAPGTHIPMLAALFPHLRFVLIDPAPFRIRDTAQRATLPPTLLPPAQPMTNVVIRQERFTDELAATFSDSDCLFISDIRGGDWQTMGADEVEEAVACDMTTQMRWHRLIKPRWSLLKFRLPWRGGVTRYLAGRILLPIWGPPTTTESRLVVEAGAEMQSYDNLVYQEEMFFFNTVTRVTLHPQRVQGPGLDRCYDCAAEAQVLSEYVRAVAPLAALQQQQQQQEVIGQMSTWISKGLEESRTLADGNLDPEHRLSNMLARKWMRMSEAARTKAKEKKRQRTKRE